MAAQKPRGSNDVHRPEVAAVLITDETGVIESAGGAVTEILGTAADDVTGTPAAELFGTSQAGTPVDVRHSGTPARWGGIVVRPPAPDTPRSVTVFPMMGSTRGSVVVVSAEPEPTSDRNREQALLRSNAQLESFASVAAHDLQEPLRKIRAFSDRVRTLLDPNGAEKALEYLARVDAAAARMQTLITDLLALARVSGREPERIETSLDQIVQSVLQDLADRTREVGATFDVEHLPDVIADSSQMRQLFTNVIGNSLKYHRPDVPLRVTISGTSLNGRVLVRVEDNGIGFDNRYLTKIFAPFERLHGREEYEGTGVGLALCRTIVERHGGTITGHGRPGEGAEFVIDMPAS